MNGEDGSDKCASPRFSSQRVEGRKQHDGGKGVNDDAGKMMQAWLHAEQLAVEHVRQGGDGMPVGGVKMRKGPSDIGKAQPTGHATRAINVIVIIVTDPIEVRGLPENDPDQGGKGEDDENFLRLQTEAQTIHGGTSRERSVISQARSEGRASAHSSTFRAKTDSSSGSSVRIDARSFAQ